MAEEEHDDDADEDRGQVHLVVRGAVPVGPHVGVPAQGGHIKKSLFLVLFIYLLDPSEYCRVEIDEGSNR